MRELRHPSFRPEPRLYSVVPEPAAEGSAGKSSSTEKEEREDSLRKRYLQTAEGYHERLTAATGVRYRRDAYLSDMDAGFYSADYLRAWIRCAQLRQWLTKEVGEDWWRNRATGDHLRSLFAEGTRPSSEDIAGRLGFDPHDTQPLLHELGA